VSTVAKTRVIGLGNPILGDDGVGWRVAERIRDALDDAEVEVLCLAVGGVSLMEEMVGCDRAVLVDAVVTGGTPGDVVSGPLDALGDPACGHTASTHDTTLVTALSVGRALKAPLPEDVWVVGVEVDPAKLNEFSEALSPAVAAALPEAVKRVQEWLAHSAPLPQRR
jgi:hydrogenase maturation protease